MAMSPHESERTSVVEAAGGLLWRDSEPERHLAIIHRARYDDWTLPKGKLKPGESWQECALREIREETQCDAQLGDFVGCSCYSYRSVVKVVLFWNMELVHQHRFAPNQEVDQLVWLPAERALEQLSYANDRVLVEKSYYLAQRSHLMERFDRYAACWKPGIAEQFGDDFAADVLEEARREFRALIPQIPYIGGDDNHLTPSLVKSAHCLALYRAMKARDKTAAETGKLLYDAIMACTGEPIAEVAPEHRLTDLQLMERRRERAERTQLQRYADDWLYDFIPGDGETFDYGYDFHECATQKLYHNQDADEFLPFYCFLDFAESRVHGLGLSRTMTLAEGHSRCDHRFKKGRTSEPEWPPSFMEEG